MRLALTLVAVTTGVAFAAAASQASTPAPAPIVFAANRAPTLTGEIYRVDPNGNRVNLSSSPFQDENPAVSPNGEAVAFLSDRLGGTSVYEVGIDGSNLALVAPHLRATWLNGYSPYGDIYWQPHGARLAVGTTRVSIVQPSRKPIVAAGKAFATSSSPWSPDGKVLAVWTGKRVRGVSAQGRVLWTVKVTIADAYAGGSPSGAWSSTGLLALDVSSGVVVYDERGHQRLAFPHASSFAWSPNGRLLALALPKSTVVVTARGIRVLRTPHGFGGWIDDHRLGLYANRKCKFLDVRTGAMTSGSCGNWFYTPRSADGKLAIVTPAKGKGFTLGVAPARGGPVQAYTHVAGCSTGNGGVEWTPAPGSLQFAGRTRSIVYESWGSCDSAPAADLYEVEPDGSGLKQLTHLSYGAGAMEPRVSPDGTEIAYVSYDPDPGMCGQTLQIATSSGAPVDLVTDDWDYYNWPAWSPNGKTVLDSGMSCSGDPRDGELFTLPANGGPLTYLHVWGDEAAWGPARIAFVGSSGLTTANPNGKNRVVVSKAGRSPAWSPSGQLAYLRKTSLVIDGSPAVQLPFAHIETLEWTSDGTRLVVAAGTRAGGPLDLYSLNPDGTDIVRLTTNFGVLGNPPFS